MKQFTDYEKTKTRENLEKQLDYHKSLATAWEKVTRNYKKNGEPFADLAKNFNSVSISNARYSLKPEKEITVCTQTEKNGYQSESISNADLVKYSNIKPDESRIITEPCLEPYFYLTIDEIGVKIAEKIEIHEKRVAELEKAIRENDKDNNIMEKLLETIAAELAQVNPDTASFYKSEIIRKYY